MVKEVKCKKCGEKFEYLKVLEHAIINHNDKEAASLLELFIKVCNKGV